MPLVEIIPAVQTSEATKNTARDLIDSWKKVTVLTKDTPGFIVNRVARPFYGEALKIYEEGIADFKWRHHNYPLHQMRGTHTLVPSMLINQHRIADEKDNLK